MNKAELLENYTAEQLADMVVKLDIASEISAKQIYNLESKIKNLEEENGRLQAKVDTYNNFLLPKATKDAYEQIARNHFTGIRIVTWDEWNNRVKAESEKVILPKEYENYIREILDIDTSEIKDDCHRFSVESLQRYLKIEKPKKQDEIEKLKKENDELKTENAELHCEMQAMSIFPDEIPAEPIKVADMLISAEGEYGHHNPIAKAICGTDKGTYRIFDVADLRQIAEHLLVYCEHQGENKNE